jgi:integrase
MPIQTLTKNGRRRHRWYFKRVINGKRIRRTKLLPAGISTEEADALARRWEHELYATASGARRPAIAIWDCVRAHVADKAGSWKDARKRIQILEKWAPEYASQDAQDLHDWSKGFVAYLRATRDRYGLAKRPLTDGSIRNVLAYIRAAIKYAHKIGLLDTDQTARMVIPSVNNDRQNYPERLTMLAIAKACADRQVRAAIRIAFYSGMRRSEIFRAQITRQGFALRDTKNGKPRIIPIHPRVAVLARRIHFTIKVKKFETEYVKARVAAGFPETRFHDLRHGSASEMINGGADLYTVGGVLGHLSTASTKRYAHLLTARLAEAVNRIGRRH